MQATRMSAMSSVASRRSLVIRATAAGTPPPVVTPPPVRQQTGREWMLAQPGICAPTGYFDPAGLTSGTPFTVSEAKKFRESELMHGRVAMLAVLGWGVAEEFHPLFGGQIEGPAFVHFQKVEGVWPQFWEVILLFIGIAEAYRIGVAYNAPGEGGEDAIKAKHTPGDLGFDPLGLYPKDMPAQMDIRTREINNGRLAMIAIAGFAGQEEVDHKTIWKGLGLTGFDAAPPPALPPYN